MVFLFFLVSSASFGTGNPGLAEPIHRGDHGGTGNPGVAEPIHRGDRGGTGNPGVAVPDFYLAGLSRAGRLGVGLRFFCHGAQTFPVGLCGAAAFCGINCVKRRSATAPQSGYYF